MDLNIIIFIAFGGALFILICGALGMHIAGEKGKSTMLGFFVGLIPFFGHLTLAMLRSSDAYLVDEMHSRDLMNFEDYTKTKEFVIKHK